MKMFELRQPGLAALAGGIVTGFVLPLLCSTCATGLRAEDLVLPDRLLVKAKPHLSAWAAQRLFSSLGAEQEGVIPQIGVRLLRVPASKRDTVLTALQHHPNIEFAEADYLFAPSATPNDPKFASQWHLARIQAPLAWDTTTGDAAVTIAILDTGVDGAHPDLASKLVAGWNFYDGNADTSDVYGHGTLVAGAAAAASNNGLGVAATAWGCAIMPVRVSDRNGYGSSSAIARALTWVADRGVRVANVGYAVSNNATVRTALEYFFSKGGVATVPAGNDGRFEPAPDNPYALTVSATDTADGIASWSNTGNNLDLAAPGVSILTTARGGTYGWSGGTSLAAPIAAGVAALVISVNPGLTAAQVQDLLKQNADDLGAIGWDTTFGSGRLNAARAVQAARPTAPPDDIPPSAAVTAPADRTSVSGTVTIHVSASDDVGVSAVECYVDGVLLGTKAGAPASFSWDTRAVGNGWHSLQACAFDAAGNSGTSSAVTVNVQNDLAAPTVRITAPSAGSIVSGTVTVAVSGSDDVGVTRVEWYLDGALKGASASASANFAWDTAATPDGVHTLSARACDAAGNAGVSASVSVTVQNSPPDTLAPAVRITSPANGAKLAKVQKIYVTASDNIGVTAVELYIDGRFFASSTSASPVFTWNTAKAAPGPHTLQAFGMDAAGNKGASAVATVSK